MVDLAEAEERVILTCDRTFIRMGYSEQAFYVRTSNKQEQVREVLAHFNITIKADSLLSRCAKCNGTFFPRYPPTACLRHGKLMLDALLAASARAGAPQLLFTLYVGSAHMLFSIWVLDWQSEASL